MTVGESSRRCEQNTTNSVSLRALSLWDSAPSHGGPVAVAAAANLQTKRKSRPAAGKPTCRVTTLLKFHSTKLTPSQIGKRQLSSRDQCDCCRSSATVCYFKREQQPAGFGRVHHSSGTDDKRTIHSVKLSHLSGVSRKGKKTRYDNSI